MNYKLINRLDPLVYLGLVLVGFIMPEVVYRLFLFDFTAVLAENQAMIVRSCLLYTSPSPRDRTRSRMPSSA